MGRPPTNPADTERTRSLWFALLLTLANGFLDAHTYLARGGVFANVQTANVIFFAIDGAERKWAAAFCPRLADTRVHRRGRAGRVHQIRPRRARSAASAGWTMAVQAWRGACTRFGCRPDFSR